MDWSAVADAGDLHDDLFALAGSALHQEPGDLGVVVEGVALDRVEDRLGQVVEVHPGRVAHIVHHDLDRELAPARPRAPPGLAEELVDQRLVVARLGGQAVDRHLDHALALAGAHLAMLGPAVGHAAVLRACAPCSLASDR